MFDVVNGSPRGAARPVAEVLGAIVGIVLAVSACGGGADVDGSVEARDPLRRGPQGNVAQFVVECELSHFAYDDPIVHPGMAGMSHQHQFFGNADVTADPDYQRVRGADTSCERSSDTASYWAPALLDERGEVIEPAKLTAYYRPGPGVDPATVEPYPAGLMMVAGDAFATEQQPLDVVAWGCGTGSRREPTPPDCRVRLDGGEGAGVEPATTESLRMWVTFPDCWDGRTLSTEAVSSHVSDSVDGDCPDSHPVPNGHRLPRGRPRRPLARVRRDRDRPRRLLERVGSGDPRAGGPAVSEPRPRLWSQQRSRRSVTAGAESVRQRSV